MWQHYLAISECSWNSSSGFEIFALKLPVCDLFCVSLVSSVRNEDLKIKFENSLEKKCKTLELLGDSLVFKEEEVLLSYKEKLETAKLDRNPAMLEKRALLQETDSDEDDEE